MHGRGRFGVEPKGKAHEMLVELETGVPKAQDNASHRVARTHADVDGAKRHAVAHELHARAFPNRNGLFENLLFPLRVEHPGRRGRKERKNEKAKEKFARKTALLRRRCGGKRFGSVLDDVGFVRVRRPVRIGPGVFRGLRFFQRRAVSGRRIPAGAFLILTPDRRVGRPVGRGRFRRSALEGGLLFRSVFRTSGVGRPLFGRFLSGTNFGLGRSGFGRRFPGDLGGCGPVFVVSVGINLFGHG